MFTTGAGFVFGVVEGTLCVVVGTTLGASLAFLMILQYVIGNRRWMQSVVVAVILTAVLYIVMRYGFGVPVPGPQIFE